MQEQDDNMTEIANAIFSDLLTENPDQAISAFGPNRIVPDRWKGMSPEQLEQIRKDQLRQVQEKQVGLLDLDIKINTRMPLCLYHEVTVHVLHGFPSLSSGMPRTPCCCPSRGSSSTFTRITRAFAATSLANSSTFGPTTLQGPHQSA